MLFATLLALLGAPSPTAVLFVGRVTDSLGVPIAEARVIVLEANRSTMTDAEGRFQLDAMPEGNYGVSIAAIGFRPRVYRVVLSGREVRLDARLLPSVVELPGIQTTATPLGTSVLDSPQPLSVLHGEALQGAQASSLGAVLEGLPGLRNLSTGSGIGKPVIRGLTSNRVLILDNGQRVESQQWGDEHAPDVETATAERIEVIRGPASVLYGSDALGGVINIVQRELPDATGQRAIFRGHGSGGYTDNGRARDGSLLIEGAQGAIGFRATATARAQGDVNAPTGALANSGLAMRGASGAVGYRAGWGSITASMSHRAERLELHEDPAEGSDATPFQRIGSTRGTVTANIPLGGARLEVDLGAERNRRREFEERGATDVALGLLSTTTSINAHLHQSFGARIAGVLGVSVLRNAFEKFGEETLIPDNHSTAVGLYAFSQMDRGALQVTAGARVDHRRLTNAADTDLGVSTGRRDANAVTGNIGVLYRLSGDVALVTSVGRGFRAPSAFELFSNGVHEGSLRYEIGDPALANETSLNGDVAIRVQSSTMQGEFGFFRNAIQNYIYPNPTGNVDPSSGFRIYDIAQGDALLKGVEASLEYHPIEWLHLQAGGDYTHGQNTTLGVPLAFVAPLRVTGGIRLEGGDRGVLGAPFVRLSAEHNTKQGRIDPDDFAPDAYTLATFGAGGTVAMGGRAVRIDLQVRNLFDTEYRSFLSRYKYFADDLGRSVSVRMGVDW